MAVACERAIIKARNTPDRSCLPDRASAAGPPVGRLTISKMRRQTKTGSYDGRTSTPKRVLRRASSEQQPMTSPAKAKNHSANRSRNHHLQTLDQSRTGTPSSPRRHTFQAPDLPPCLLINTINSILRSNARVTPLTLVNDLCVFTCKTSPSTEAPGSTTLSTCAPPAASESLRCLSRSATAAGFPKSSHFERSPIVGKPSEIGNMTAITKKAKASSDVYCGTCFSLPCAP